jgi:hypothetical protein
MVPVSGEQDVFEISLQAAIAAEMDDFLQQRSLLGKTSLHTGQLRKCVFSEKITEKQNFSSEVIHRFHPLIQFISTKNSQSECSTAFPLYACKLINQHFAEGHYVVMARVASFSGIKEDETVLVAAKDLKNNTFVDRTIAQRLFEKARQEGTEWINVQFDIDLAMGAVAAEALEEELRLSFRELKQEKQNQNMDRTEVLLQLANDHLAKKTAGFLERIANHEQAAELAGSVQNAQRRKALASAERKKMEDFKSRVETRIAQILRKREAFSADSREICALVVKVSKEA